MKSSNNEEPGELTCVQLSPALFLSLREGIGRGSSELLRLCLKMRKSVIVTKSKDGTTNITCMPLDNGHILDVFQGCNLLVAHLAGPLAILHVHLSACKQYKRQRRGVTYPLSGIRDGVTARE